MIQQKNLRKKRNKIYHYSYSRKLRNEGKITPQFEIMLNSLCLEDLIALKLEQSAKALKGKLFGFPVWRSTFYIVKSALVRFALSAAASQKEAANLLGISISELRKNIKQFDIFDKEKEDD